MKYLIQVKIPRSLACVRNIAMNTQTFLKKKKKRKQNPNLPRYFVILQQVLRLAEATVMILFVWFVYYVPICDFCTQTILS